MPDKSVEYEYADRMAYRKCGVTVVTLPMKFSGYYFRHDALGPMIFVKSQLPRAERSAIVSELISRAKEVQNAKS